jgi:hypothetical protein
MTMIDTAQAATGYAGTPEAKEDKQAITWSRKKLEDHGVRQITLDGDQGRDFPQDPEGFDQSLVWQLQEISLGDGRILVLDDT